MLDPIVKSVVLPISRDRAFDLFTDQIADWWPLATHSLLSAAGKIPVRVQFEPFEGGRLFETSDTGETIAWGEVTAWDKGKHLGFSWHVGSTPDRATQVDVAFEPADQGGTRITLTHSNWEVLGDQAPELHGNYTQGWDGVLHSGFADYVNAQV